ncbi:MAG: uridine kinase [Vulcanimicrobiota bacterium]
MVVPCLSARPGYRRKGSVMSDSIRNITSPDIHTSYAKRDAGAFLPSKDKPASTEDTVTLNVSVGSSYDVETIKQSMSGKAELLTFSQIPGLDHIAVASLNNAQPLDEAQYKAMEEQMTGYMRAWPSVTSVITIENTGGNESAALVKSRPDAIAGSTLEGVYEVVERLSSSPSIKEAAMHYPSEFHVVKCLNDDESGSLHEIHLPGRQTTQSLSLALGEGGVPNRLDQVQQLIENLPQGQRVALILAGPSSGGKSTLIAQVKEFADKAGRKAVDLQGDMYFRDIDDPDYPRTPDKATLYWDSIEAVDVKRFKEDISTLIQNGSADVPIYNFTDTRPGGWRLPDVKFKGYREEKPRHMEIGNDDILVIDSLHAANREIISHLNSLGLAHATIYLDSEMAEDRLMRRMIRDYAERGGILPESSLEVWDKTTWLGEKQFVRPTILQMDPGKDTFLVTKFPKDPGLSREEINTKVEILEKYGLAPTYEAFAAPPEKLGEMARAEEKQMLEILSSDKSSESQREKAAKALNRLRSAPCYSGESTIKDIAPKLDTLFLPPTIGAAISQGKPSI